MADNKLQIELEFLSNGEVKLKKISDALGDLEESAKKTANSISQSSNSWSGDFSKSLLGGASAFNLFKAEIAAEAVIAGLTAIKNAAVGLFDIFIVQGVAAARAQEDSMNALTSAMRAAGTYSDAAAKDFENFAAQIQKTTKYQDDAVISAAALIEEITGLGNEALQGATRAAIGLSAALGKDLDTTAQAVARAIEGDVGALSRFGIKIVEGSSQLENFNRVMEATARFSKTAQEQTNTYSGSLALLQNSFGETQESIGNVIVNNQSLINVFKSVAGLLDQVTDYINSNRDSLSKLVSEGVVGLVEGVKVATQYLGVFVEGLVMTEKAAIGAFYATRALFALKGGDGAAAFQFAKEAAANIKDLGSSLEKAAAVREWSGKIVANLDEIKAAAERGFDSASARAARAGSSFGDVTEKVGHLSKAQKELAEQGKKIFDEALNKSDPNREYNEKLNALKAYIQEAKKTEEDYNKALVVLQDERIQKLSEVYLKENEVAIARSEENSKLIAENLYANEERVRNNQAALAQIMESEKLSTKDREKLERKYQDTERELSKQRVSNQRDTLAAISTLATANSKELQVIGKAAAMTTATIDGIVAVQKALASAPPPFNFVLAGLVGAATAINVAKIAGVPLEKGGEVPSGFPNDTFPARLTSGETVVDRSTTDNLKGFLAQNEGTNALLTQILGRLNRLEPQVNVRIGERELADAMRDTVRSGRSFQ